MNKFQICTFSVLVLIIGISCSKEDNNLDNQLSNDKTYRGDIVDPSNADNPFDSAGVVHNDSLKMFIDSVLIPNKDSITHQDVVDFFGFSSADSSRIFKNYRSSNISYPNYDESQNSFNDYYEADSSMFLFYYDLREYINDTSLSLAAKVDSIRNYENSFDFSGFSNDQKKVAQIAASIGRYSIVFWAPSAEGGLNNYDDLHGEAGACCDWWEVGRADIFGAAMAAFTTANPFVALGWGVGNSAVNAADQYFIEN